MTEDFLTTDKHLDDLKDMDIKVENIYHVTLLNGDEFIAELIPEKKKKDLVFLYPVRLIKDSFIDEEGIYNPSFLMVEYNVCTDQPYIPVNSKSITSMVTVNKETLMFFTETVKVYYFPDILVDLEGLESLLADPKTPLKIEKEITNIIPFDKYFKKQ